MFSRFAMSAVFIAAFTLVSASCSDGHPAAARTSVPTSTVAPVAASISTPAPTSVPVQTARPVSAPTSTSAPAQTSVRTSAPAPTVAPAVASISTPAPTSVPVQTARPVSAPTSTSVPAQTSVPTLMPVAATVSAPMPVPISTSTPISTQTATPALEPTYLGEEVPPCTPAPGAAVDPCGPRAEWDSTTGRGGHIIFDAPLHVDYLLNGSPTVPIYTTHVVLRGTYIPGTVRCTSGHRIRFPSYVGEGFGGLLIYCFADVRVNAYLLGSGPPTLTVTAHTSLYALSGDDDDYGLGQLESRRLAYERALAEGGRFEYEEPLRGYLPPDGGAGPLRLEDGPDGLAATGPPGGIGGREVVMFIRPSISVSVETWEVRYKWDVERRDDATVVAIHPYREWFNLETHGSLVEMELAALTQAVTTAHQQRVVANGGRIGADDSLPMLVTDANQLRQYYTEVGAYAPGVPAPAQPPPPCGLAVPDQADNPGLMRDCINLLAAKDTLRGTATLNWSVDTPISDWDGVTVQGSPSRVKRLVLVEDSLTGTLPPELGRLDGLEYLWLGYNQLTGEIPAALGGLASLKSLLFNRNRLTGAVPRELGGLSRLESLWLNENQLSGEIPASLGDLNNLRQLLLAGNRLSGAIPSVLGDLSNLEHLKLNYNQLTGEIPSALGRLSNLKDLLLGVNQLNGCIPPALRNVDDNDLDSLGLQDCAAP